MTPRPPATPITMLDRVRVVSLTGSGADHLVSATAERAPQVGDVGTVVDVTRRMGGVGNHYTVELRITGLKPVWLAVFAAHELQVVPR